LPIAIGRLNLVTRPDGRDWHKADIRGTATFRTRLDKSGQTLGRAARPRNFHERNGDVAQGFGRANMGTMLGRVNGPEQ